MHQTTNLVGVTHVHAQALREVFPSVQTHHCGLRANVAGKSLVWARQEGERFGPEEQMALAAETCLL